MALWAEQDAINYDHFRDIMQVWAGGMLPVSTAGDDRVAGREREPSQLAAAAGESPVHRLERGEISVAEFERLLAREFSLRGSPKPLGGLVHRMLSNLASLEPDMISMVRRARAQGVRTALLSNSWGDHYPESLWDGLFDEIVISGRVGMRKPDPEIFHYTCTSLGLAPGRCVMVDDMWQNVRGAVAVGMVGVLHHSYDETRAQLETLFDLSLA
jgi:epoxide hydrolase-like predicted phosphatase